MHLDRRDRVGLALVALAIVVSVVASPQLPDQLAIHFDASGQPDSVLAKPLALAIAPLLGLGVVGLFKVLPWLDPLGENVAEFQDAYDLVAVTTVGVIAYVQVVIVTWNLGYAFSVVQATVPVLAVTYYVVGVVVERAEQNWFVGIRTPWTLSNEEVWQVTHERTAVLFKLAGLVALLAFPFPGWFVLLAVGPVLAAALVATVYSFVVYRRVAAD